MSAALFPLRFSASIAASLPPDLANLLAAINLSGAVTATERVSAFLDRLFSRSTPEVVRGKTEEQVQHIVLGCL